MTLEGHQSEIWTLALSREGNFLLTAGHDREIRQWVRGLRVSHAYLMQRQTDRQLFLEEQREMEMEEQWDKTLEVRKIYSAA